MCLAISGPWGIPAKVTGWERRQAPLKVTICENGAHLGAEKWEVEDCALDTDKIYLKRN